jgi:hypothetical protein
MIRKDIKLKIRKFLNGKYTPRSDDYWLPASKLLDCNFVINYEYELDSEGERVIMDKLNNRYNNKYKLKEISRTVSLYTGKNYCGVWETNYSHFKTLNKKTN